MTDKNLKNLIGFIKNKDYTVMWNDGYDKYIILKEEVREYSYQLKVYFQDFQVKHIDLRNCDFADFLIFNKELS
jgi:hypothetical protein